MSTVETKQSLWKPSVNCIICVCSFVLIVILSEIFLGHYLYKTLEHDLRKHIVNDFRNGVFKEEILQILEDPETSTQYLRFLNKKDKNDVKYVEFYKPGVLYDDNNSDSDSWTWPTDCSRIPVKAIEGFCKAINQHCPESVTSKRKRRQLYYNRVVHTDDRRSDGRRDSGVRGFYGEPRSSRSGEPGLPGPPGPPGRTGPPGIPGPAGPPGPIGPPGVQGPIGNTGERGDIGLTGLQGEQGLPGQKGDAGLSGPPGVPGPQGTPGNSGLQGHPGPQGHIGPLGLQGFPGDEGPPGPPGIQGEAGVPGLDGSPGLEGPIGLPGVDGSPGVPGEEGLPGLDGVPGSNGIDGLPGPPGPAGSQGSPGLQGPPGVCQCCADALNEPSVRVPKWEIRPYGTEQYSGHSPRKMEYMLEYIESPVNYGISNDFKSWMVDSDVPTDEDTEKFWVTTEDNYTLFEYDNKASFLLNTPTRSYDLYIPFEGTSNVVYKGSFFYKAAQSKSRIIKYFLNNQSSQALSIPNLNTHNLKYLYNTGYNYFDFSVDDNGLWVIFAVPYTNNTGVMKVDPDTMTTQYIWNITLDHTKFNEMFVASGFLYTIDKSIKNEMKISFAVDLYTKKLFHVDLSSAEHVQDITMATYDYRWKELLLLDNGTRSAYPVVFGENNFVGKEVFPE